MYFKIILDHFKCIFRFFNKYYSIIHKRGDIVSNIMGERISYLRYEKNLTRDQLCKIIGVSKRTIVAYEQGTREPSIKTLRALIEYFNVSADYILGYTNKPLRLDTICKEENSFILLPKTIQESKAKYNSVNDYIDYIAAKKD